MSAPEPEADATKTRHSGWSSAIWLSLVILILYALSPGPAYKLASNGGKDMRRTLGMVYAPLILLDQKVPAVGAFYEWYFRLWGVEPAQSRGRPKL